jgi:hypothetical protein
MAYDATTQSVVMFGGYSNATNTVFGDTWTWNGRTKSWTQQNPLSSPSPRRAPIAYDGARGQVVLFGGDDPSVGTIFPDTWTWNGTTWKQQSPVVSPSQRGLASLAYDASLAKVLLFGGFIPGFCPNDTWAWDGSGWSAVSTVRAPVGRFAFGMASNPATNGVVLFGGFGCGYTLGDTWAVSPGD